MKITGKCILYFKDFLSSDKSVLVKFDWTHRFLHKKMLKMRRFFSVTCVMKYVPDFADGLFS